MRWPWKRQPSRPINYIGRLPDGDTVVPPGCRRTAEVIAEREQRGWADLTRLADTADARVAAQAAHNAVGWPTSVLPQALLLTRAQRWRGARWPVVSAQTFLPSLRTGRGSYPTAYLHPGEMIQLRGTNFVVMAEAVITIQYEDGGWNVLPMAAHRLGEPMPRVPAWVTEVDLARAHFANRSRPRPRWRPLKHVTGKD